MTEPKTTAVQVLMNQATNTTGPGALLALAAEMTKPKSAWKGARKLTHEEALVATRAVTAMLTRYGLRPTQVLVSAGRASLPAATGRFYLTRKEMEPGAVVRKRLATGIDAHLASVKAIARFAREAGHPVDEEALLGELAEAVTGFLEQFRGEPELDADAELARDVNRIAEYLGSPRRGFELGRFLAEAGRQDLVFDAETGGMNHEGPAAYMHDGNTPTIPLLTRVVAHAEVSVSKGEWEAGGEDTLLFARPKLTPAGRTHCAVCEEVGLGVVPDPDRRGGLRMVFTLDPVTYVGEPGDGATGEHWNTVGYDRFLRVSGYPNPGEQERLGKDDYWFEAASPDRYECEEFRAYYGRLLAEMEPGDEERLWFRRHLSVTPETCRLLLVNDDRTAFWILRSFSDITERSVMPPEAEDDAGVTSRTVRDRFSALLYAEAGPTAAGLLEAEAARRTEALDAFLLKSATGLRRRKLAFRARMRK